MPLNSFHKTERLKSFKRISELFESGHSYAAFPVKVLWQYRTTDVYIPVKAGFTVPKRNFRKAVQRNLLKRRMKEAFRLNRSGLTATCSSSGTAIDLMFIYVSGRKEPYDYIEESVKTLLSKIRKEVNK